LIFANDADEKLRKYRALCSVEMLRATWEKTSSPYIRAVTARHRARIQLQRRYNLLRPSGSRYTRPIVVQLYFDGTEAELREADELVLDVPGGGFIAMRPVHHEERLLRWAQRLRRPVLSVDYGKAPEYPFPYAINEIVDLFRLLVESKGAVVGMGGTRPIKMVLTGDSAGANIATAALYRRALYFKRTRQRLRQPQSSRP
jgi:acetyl esterase/lipase